MRFRLFAFAGLAALLALAPVAAAADPGCCKHCSATACAMPCCNHDAEPTANAIDILLSMDDGTTLLPMEQEHPARQTATVLFDRPVWVGRTVLMGKYIIEHDTDRQARGEPCTHLYAANDLKTPIVTFHCTHIDGERVDRDTVVLQTLPDGMRKFVQFQFAGETAAHGFTTER